MPDLEPADAGRGRPCRARPDEGCCAAPRGSASRDWQRGYSPGQTRSRAATAAPGPATSGAAHEEPLIVHVHDARTGVVDLYTGTRHVRFTDHQLAARLARAAGLQQAGLPG